MWSDVGISIRKSHPKTWSSSSNFLSCLFFGSSHAHAMPVVFSQSFLYMSLLPHAIYSIAPNSKCDESRKGWLRQKMVLERAAEAYEMFRADSAGCMTTICSKVKYPLFPCNDLVSLAIKEMEVQGELVYHLDRRARTSTLFAISKFPFQKPSH